MHQLVIAATSCCNSWPGFGASHQPDTAAILRYLVLYLPSKVSYRDPVQLLLYVVVICIYNQYGSLILVWLVPCTSQLSSPPRAALHGLVLVLCINQIPPPFLAALIFTIHILLS
jgi:hypothetical protein